MRVNYGPEGIHVEPIDLWLDPQVSKPAAWLSHAHSDHARFYSANALATPVTLQIYRLRWPENPEFPQTLYPMEYRQPVDFHGARLTAYPAGHILGAAQLLIEHGGERLLYTGDLKLNAPLLGDATEVVETDHLIIESTFGLPIYHFLSREEARMRISDFARECLADGAVPVFTGYPLGRGQEIVHCLAEAGIPVAVHGAIAKYIPAYERHGYQFGDWEDYKANVVRGKAIVTIPGLKRNLEARGVDMRAAYVSGWAAVDNARLRANAEMLIPYSDHAGFDELLALVTRSQARRVDVVHGYAEAFAKILRDRGIHAQAPRQAALRVSEEEAA
jgi:Cft2 family RNA processing exonuclease